MPGHVSSDSKKGKFQTALAAAVTGLLGLQPGLLYLLGSPDPFGTLLLYLVSFVWLPLPLLAYSNYYPAQHRIGEEELVRRIKAISTGIGFALVTSLFLSLVAAFSPGSRLNLRSLVGLNSVWFGSLLLPFLSVGPPHTILLSRARSPSLSTFNLAFGSEVQSLFASSLVVSGLGKYVFRFVATTWVSTVLLAYGWYLIFRSPVALLGLVTIPAPLLLSRSLVLPVLSPEGVLAVRGRVEQVAKSLPFKPISLVLGLSFFSAWLFYLALLQT